MKDFILAWISLHGYPALFLTLMLGIVGVPIPDEVLLMFAGYLAYKGELDLAPTIAVGFFGSAAGISISYLLGATGGSYLVHRFGRHVRITPEKLERARGWFNRRGRWSLLLGYFVPGVRHLIAFIAGTSTMSYSIFAMPAYSGGLVWVLTFVLLGYFSGREWRFVYHLLDRSLVIVAITIMAFLLALYVLLIIGNDGEKE